MCSYRIFSQFALKRKYIKIVEVVLYGTDHTVNKIAHDHRIVFPSPSSPPKIKPWAPLYLRRRMWESWSQSPSHCSCIFFTLIPYCRLDCTMRTSWMLVIPFFIPRAGSLTRMLTYVLTVKEMKPWYFLAFPILFSCFFSFIEVYW